MNNYRWPCQLAICCIVFGTPSLEAQQADTTFFVIGKHHSFAQSGDSAPARTDYSFFSEIFLTSDGEISEGSLRFPDGRQQSYQDQRLLSEPDRDNVFLVSGEGRYETRGSLEQAYPDGEYYVDFGTPSGDVKAARVEFNGHDLPPPPRVALSQNGSTLADAIDPNAVLRVSWSHFDTGQADPGGILDDLIFVILRDCQGHKAAHSGRPFEGTSYLSYATDSYIIAADQLEPGMEYTLQVEHAILVDTQRHDGIPGFATYAVTTSYKFRTAGNPAQADYCASAGDQSVTPSIDANTLMFYYENLEEPEDFYGRILGLDKTLDWDWVKFFRTSPSAQVGLVKDSDGAYHKPQRKNAVMLSIVTSEIDAWYAKVQFTDGAVFLRELATRGPIRSFLLEDPGGYTVEFYEWVEKPD